MQPLIPQSIQSPKNSLNWNDIKTWIYETFIFSVPALLIFLETLQQKGDIRIAIGAGYMALLSSLINLLGKFKQGN